ncbi:nucleoplasmin-2 [Macrotis lagotis]|uniref:nucleoplasmin-2 n=1 Tax=Macrotis lagotis TaxID=92651 RepID=UPI003D699284
MPPSSVSSKAEKSLSLFWGCELNWNNRSYTFDPSEDEKGDHKLKLQLICLGEKSTDDVNVVEIIPPPSEDGEERPAFPIATLKLSVLPMANISGMELTPPITFHLRCGSGPVYISGHDLTVNLDPSWIEAERNEDREEDDDDEDNGDDDDDDDDDDDEDDNDEESEDISLEEISPPKSAKRRASSKGIGKGKSKKARTEFRK